MIKTKYDCWEVWGPHFSILTAGTGEQCREEIEELLKDALGFFVMLEYNDEDTDEYGKAIYKLYLHSDNEEDRTEEELAYMAELGLKLSDTIENQDQAIRKILAISVTR